jgi:plasmid stabilization system protein ParE
MAYLVEITPRAKNDLNRIYNRVVRAAPYRGPIWFERFEHAIQSLENFPERYEPLPKFSTPDRIVRQLLFGRRRNVYRAFYTIIGPMVWVIHVRHGARREPARL